MLNSTDIQLYCEVYVFKMHLLLCIVLLIVPAREAALGMIRNATHPDHVGKCYEPGPPPTIISVNNTKRHPTDCARMTCGKDFTLFIATCGVEDPRPNCWKIPGNPSKPYPHCCPETIC